jgi:hypothetical protein
MNVFWLAPPAFWGLVLLAVPIAVHLLTRQQTRRIPFPTLRFLRPTRLAALRRRSIHDWVLLIVRLAILTAATAALAGPVFVSRSRQAQWQTRVVRAFVLAPSSSAAADAIVREESAGSFASAAFRPTTSLADGIRDATEWLARQPPAAREVVIAGDLKDGTLAEPELSLVPSTAGLRFLPTPSPVATDATVDLPFAVVVLTSDGTRLTYREPAAASGDPLLVRAASVDLAFAEAARQAILTRGIRRDRALDRRVLVAFDGANVDDLQVRQPATAPWMRDALSQLPGMTGGEASDRLVVRVPMRANDVDAAHVIDRIARVAFAEDLRALEPRVIPAATLARWSRPPAADPDAPLSDEGDRRWLWGLALAFIAVETVLRRARPVAEAPHVQEQQVA